MRMTLSHTVIVISVILAGCGELPLPLPKPPLPVTLQMKTNLWWGQYMSLTNHGKELISNVRENIYRPDGATLEFATGGLAPNEEWTGNMPWIRTWIVGNTDRVTLSADGYTDVVLTGL